MYEQAFHTCCKRGLTSQPGFQYNAVSPGLSEATLARLASTHAGYQAPRDTPSEPNLDQLSMFPVSLRHQPVDGVGAVLSQTRYVGREFRGHNGEPDTGRFGNYFSHILVGGDIAEPFEGLLPIELWSAEHWTTNESPTPVLEPIGSLAPGSLDLDSVLLALLPDRAPWIASMVDATVAALLGGPRVVVVEEPGPRAAAWVALMCFALPRSLAQALTFSTYEGRPQYVDMHLTLTTPGCDTVFPEYELGHRVTVIDVVGATQPTAKQLLLGRAVEALVKRGAEALSVAARGIAQEDTSMLGAQYAVCAGVSGIVRDDTDVLEILALVERWHETGRAVGSLAAVATDLATCEIAPSGVTLLAWSRLHGLARGGTHPESAEVADIALAHLLKNLHNLVELPYPEWPPPIDARHATVRPTVERLAEFLETITDSVTPERLAGNVSAGWMLGLVGINDELDRRFSVALAGLLEVPIVSSTFEGIRSDPANGTLVASVALALMERASHDARALEMLTLLGDDEVVDRSITDALRASDSFELWAMCARVQLRNHPERRKMFVAALAELASTGVQHAEVRRVYGSSGPTAVEEHTELLSAYGLSSRSVPAEDIDAAWRAVLACPLIGQHPRSDVEALVETLASADPLAKRHAAYVAWRASAQIPTAHSRWTLEEWMQALVYIALRPEGELPDDRYLELVAIAAELVLLEWRPGEHRARFGEAIRALGESVWLEACEVEIARQRSELTRLVAQLFEIWSAAPESDEANRTLVLRHLLPAASITTRQREKVVKALPEDLRDSWLAWSDAHPHVGTVARAVGRLKRR
jgi:GTPase-associated protein 1, N-terminal domain type 2/GTPase-associated protein 1, middle domain